MKKNIKKLLLKSGNWHNLSLKINLFFLIIYLVNEVIIFPITTAHVMSLLGKASYYFIAIKCSYALLIAIGIVIINEKPNVSWMLINLAAIGVLSILYFDFYFYSSDGIFLLVISSMWLLVLTNLKSFIKKYAIKRTLLRKIMIFAIPIIVLLLVSLKMWNYIVSFGW